MRVLITGSEGLIGRSLQKALIARNVEVQGYDKKLLTSEGVDGDILRQSDLVEAMTDCDGIIHLAAVSRVIWGEHNPALCWETNVKGTANIIEGALTHPKKPWIIYASSREVYGNQDELPVKENCLPKPVNIYGHSKAAAENLILEARYKGLNTAIVRFSNVYGCSLDHIDRVIPAFCIAAAFGQTIKIEGSHNTFDFTHLSDTVSGLVKLIDALSQNKEALPVFHFTTGQATTLKKAAELAKAAGNHRVEIVEAPSRTFDVSCFYGDATLTSKFLNWKPMISIEEGIPLLVALYRKNSPFEQSLYS